VPGRPPSWRTACSARVHASARNAFGSTVVPDFDATMNRVVSGSSPSRTAATAAGSVESRMRSSGYPSVDPKVRRNTSGARLLPPIPARTTVAKPDSEIESPKPSRLAVWSAKCSGAPSQPSRPAMASWTRGSVDHSDVSRSNRRVAQSSARACSTAASNAAAPSPRANRGRGAAVAARSVIASSEPVRLAWYGRVRSGRDPRFRSGSRPDRRCRATGAGRRARGDLGGASGSGRGARRAARAARHRSPVRP